MALRRESDSDAALVAAVAVDERLAARLPKNKRNNP
jgi:hypothetical protein